MAYTLSTLLAKRTNYGSARSTSTIKYIVIHYTAGDGDKPNNNASYFHNGDPHTSAHYFVGSTEIVQSVPDNYVAWSVGGSKYPSCSSTGGGKYHGLCTNTNSISLELCDEVKDGKYSVQPAAVANALDLVGKLMKKYNVPKANVIRHFDVVGKICPAYWCGTPAKDALWKTEFWNKIGSTATSSVTVTNPTVSTVTSSKVPYTIRATVDSLNIRTKPGTTSDCKIVGTISKTGGAYTIVEEQNGWGLMKAGQASRNRWVSLAYTKKV